MFHKFVVLFSCTSSHNLFPEQKEEKLKEKNNHGYSA